MTETLTANRLENLWNDATAAAMSESYKLLYRSNLLGSDKRVTNYGGGNTSAKVMETDPLTGEAVEVLWVKGSGGDIGSMKMDGFSTLYMVRLQALKGKYRGQTQRWFAFRFEGDESEIAINPPPGGHTPEFDAWGWKPMRDLPGLIVPFKRRVYEEVVAAFAHLAP